MRRGGQLLAQSSHHLATTLAASDTQAPTVPTGLGITKLGSTSLTLSWNASTDNVE